MKPVRVNATEVSAVEMLTQTSSHFSYCFWHLAHVRACVRVRRDVLIPAHIKRDVLSSYLFPYLRLKREMWFQGQFRQAAEGSAAVL